MFCAPVGAFAGIVNVATTVPWLGREMLVPLIVPASVTLVGTLPAGGCGGLVGSVIVTVTVVPRLALPPGATDPLPPPPVPLPQVERDVVPGLGLPHLVIDNKSAQGFGMLLSDGQICFVPARTTHEFVMDPGSFDAWLLRGAQPKLAVQEPVHFSYHARYTMVIP